MHPKKLPSASRAEDSQLKQDKTVTCTRHTDVSRRFGFVQYVGVTRWVFTDENNAEVRSLVSSRYPLLNLVTGFLPDLPGQLPSRNHNRIISATDKALPKQSASLGPSNPSSLRHRPGKMDASHKPGHKRLFYSSSVQAYCAFTPSHVKQRISVFVCSFAAQSRDRQTKLPEGPTFMQPDKAYALFFSARPRVHVYRLPGTRFKLRYH